MKIGILSDTHIHLPKDKIPAALIDGLKNVDLILHAGDILDLAVIRKLEKIAQVKAVQGNMDTPVLKEILPERELIRAEQIKIGLIHGWGPPVGLLDRVKELFYTMKVDVVIFGHSHTPMIKKIDGVLFINPGSPTDKIFAPYNSYVVLEVKGNKAEAQIVKI
ncbi:MAG: metallophosphoesterase [Candidatus Omnitrophota bacterium]